MSSTRTMVLIIALVLAVPALFHPTTAGAQPCTTKPQLQNYTGGGQSICPCFDAGEEGGSTFTAPAGDYPIEILRIGIAWASQLGTAPDQIEDAIEIYQNGLPNPTPLFSLGGPVLKDGFINEFNLEPIVGEILIPSGSFTVTLKFLITNNGDFFAPSLMTDGNGCQNGKNVVRTANGAWFNGCSLGLSGDWVFYVIYRTQCVSGVGEEKMIMSAPAALSAASPNPFNRSTSLEFFLANAGPVNVSVYDLNGAKVRDLVNDEYASGRHSVDWDGRDASGAEAASGIYFVKLKAGDFETSRKVLIAR